MKAIKIQPLDDKVSIVEVDTIRQILFELSNDYKFDTLIVKHVLSNGDKVFAGSNPDKNTDDSFTIEGVEIIGPALIIGDNIMTDSDDPKTKIQDLKIIW